MKMNKLLLLGSARYVALILTVGMAALTAPAAVLGETQVSERLDAAKDGEVSIENLSGSVKVFGTDRGEVTVDGTLGGGVEELRFYRDGDHIYIEVVIPRGDDAEGSRLEIRVPWASTVEVGTVSASIEVTGVRGSLEVDSVSGKITVVGKQVDGSLDVESISGRVRVDTDAARIEVESVSGDLSVVADTVDADLQTVSGDIEMRMKAGRAEIESVSGDLEISCEETQLLDFESVSGDLEYTGALAAKGKIDIETHSGDIEITLPADTDADFRLKTMSGDIDSELPKGSPSDFSASGMRELRFRNKKGSGRVQVTTFSGDIELEARAETGGASVTPHR
jgi:DUF4097 and DUF4098 domain-containing protein YvlB